MHYRTYAVLTQYWWSDGSTWIGPVEVWSTQIRYLYLHQGLPENTFWCELGD